MSIISRSGVDAIHALAKKENPWLPQGATDLNVRISDLTPLVGDRVSVTYSGQYGHGYRGAVTMEYDQLDLAYLMGGVLLKVGIPAGTVDSSVHQHLDDFFYYTGIKLSPGDVEDTAFASLPVTITLTAQPLSALYKGSVEIQLIERAPRLDEAVPWGDYDVTLSAWDPLTYPNARGEFFTYGIDYSDAYAGLQSTPLGTMDTPRAEALAATLTSVDENPWTRADQSGFWSLYHATVRYNGPTSMFESDDGIRYPDLKYTHVLIVDMSVNRGVGDLYGSSLFIHYNVLE